MCPSSSCMLPFRDLNPFESSPPTTLPPYHHHHHQSIKTTDHSLKEKEKEKEEMHLLPFIATITTLLLALTGTTNTVCINGCGRRKTCIRSGGSVSTGLCPGGSNNRYCDCTKNVCGSLGTGYCIFTKDGCGGTWQTGFCPGPSNYKCCN